MAPQVVILQVVNHSRQEQLYLLTDVPAVDALARLGRAHDGPWRQWAQGDVVRWQTLSDPVPLSSAERIRATLGEQAPPSGFKVIPGPPPILENADEESG